MKIKIVTDSSADLVSLPNVDFAFAPLKIITSTKEYCDNAELNVDEMIDDLDNVKGKTQTSCPAPNDWLEAFGDADNVVCLTITSALSGSYNSAMTAKRLYEEEHPERKVFVLDTLSTGPEIKLLAEKAQALINKNASFEEICKQITEYKKKTKLMFMLCSIKNLANNGRVSHLVAKITSVLKIRIVGKASDKGELQVLEKCLGDKKSLQSIINNMKNFAKNVGKVIISHCKNETLANALKTLIKSEYKDSEVEICSARGLCSFYAEKGGLLIGFECN